MFSIIPISTICFAIIVFLFGFKFFMNDKGRAEWDQIAKDEEKRKQERKKELKSLPIKQKVTRFICIILYINLIIILLSPIWLLPLLFFIKHIQAGG